LIHIDYKFATESLYNEYSKNKHNFANHTDIPKEHEKEYKDAFKDFKILRANDNTMPVIWNEYRKFVDKYNLQGHDIRPRYYYLGAGGSIPPHKDMKTLCAVNHILSDSCAPLIIEKKEYQYKTAVFDTQRMHNVQNSGYGDRVLIKLSFFDLSYEDVVAKLT
jgi:hypothetical protein